jgi:hypothetical protein
MFLMHVGQLDEFPYLRRPLGSSKQGYSDWAWADLFLVLRSVWSAGQISDSAGEISPAGPIFFGDDVAFKNAIFIKRSFYLPKSEPSFNISRIHFKTTLNM